MRKFIGQAASLLLAILICESAGLIGSFFTISSVNGWYRTLTKPTLNPPAWIFAPVWTALYFLLGVAVFLIWRRGLKKKDTRIALIVFGIQLFLNAIWSIIFFGGHSPLWAFIDIIALWLFILWTIGKFYKVSRPAALLLLPYLAWVTFASYLNFMIWRLNR